VTLKAVDDRVVALQNANDVARKLVPAKELAVVRSGNDVLAVTE
jgi:hypothetical protein